MSHASFLPETGVSYSAGVAYISVSKKIPKLLLVLQKAGEKNLQKTGDFFVEERTWKMPMGHFDPKEDTTLEDTAVREFEEETGYVLNKELLSKDLSVVIRIDSERPEARFHEDVFFLVVVESEAFLKSKKKRETAIEDVSFFPLTNLPIGNEKDSKGPAMAWGHRKKLTRLFLHVREKKLKNGVFVKDILKI